MSNSFYESDGELLVATESTRGPWDPGAQHAGPPAALLGRALEGLEDADEFQIGRISFDILRSVPIAPLRVSARVLRPGRRVQLIEAELSDAGGEVLMRATAWRLRTAAVEIPAELAVPDPAPPAPTGGGPTEFFPTGQERGYHTAMEVRFISGSFVELGPATVWLRMLEPLVAGEETTPLQRTLVVADVGNGVSATLDYRRYLFINVDLTVQLEALPVGEWIGVEARTLPRPNGVGTAESVLSDERGRIGRAAQTLLVSER